MTRGVLGRAGLGVLTRAACLLLLVLAALLRLSAAYAATHVTLVLADAAPIYQDTAEALRRELEQGDAAWQVRVQTLAERQKAEHEDLLVPLGMAALRAVLAEPAGTPVWSVLVPRLNYEAIVAQSVSKRRAVGALFLDQPLSRQMHMLRTALPRTHGVGVLLGPASEALAEPLRQAAAAYGLTLRVGEVERREDVIPALNRLRGEVDVLLLLPDPLVVHRATLQSLLLHTYRQKLPVAAYSVQLVEAGAMLALFAAPAEIGSEAARRLRQARLKGGQILPGTAYLDSYAVAVNRSVALSLGIPVPSGEQVRLSMEAGGRP